MGNTFKRLIDVNTTNKVQKYILYMAEYAINTCIAVFEFNFSVFLVPWSCAYNFLFCICSAFA